MSERDPLYDPRELLQLASRSHTQTKDELNALNNCHKLIKQLSDEEYYLKNLEHWLAQFREDNAPKMHLEIQEKYYIHQQKTKELNDKIVECSFSVVLSPVVRRVYDEERLRLQKEYEKRDAEQVAKILQSTSQLKSININSGYEKETERVKLFIFCTIVFALVAFLSCVALGADFFLPVKNDVELVSSSHVSTSRAATSIDTPMPTFSIQIPQIPTLNISQDPTCPIEIISSPGIVYRNSYATVKIKGAPNTEYSISVTYSSGPSTADGLETKQSDGEGNVIWRWKIGGRTRGGSYPITISGGGDKKTVYFDIAE